jgi:hypothetical protein
MAVKMLIMVFGIVMPYGLYPEDGGDTFLRNSGNHPQEHTLSHSHKTTINIHEETFSFEF